ncbi:MAG: STAS domain-containing protein [Nitrospirota bacterium]
MDVTTRELPDAVICDLAGDLTYANRQAFKAAVDRVKQSGCPHLIVNLERVRFIDSSGLGLLALTASTFQAQHKHLSLLRPQPYVREILTLANLAKMIPIYDSETDARRQQGVMGQANVV